MLNIIRSLKKKTLYVVSNEVTTKKIFTCFIVVLLGVITSLSPAMADEIASTAKKSGASSAKDQSGRNTLYDRHGSGDNDA